MSTQVRRPKVDVRWQGGNFSTHGVGISLQLNSEPTVSLHPFRGAEAGSSAQKVMTSEVASILGRAQTIAFSAREDPDIDLRVTDGAGGTVNLKAFTTGPSYTVDRNSRTINPSIQGVGSMALLDNLRLDVYVGSNREPGQPLDQPAVWVWRESSSANMADRLKDLTTRLIRYWEMDRGSERDPLGTAIRDTVHVMNGRGSPSPLDIWYRVLDNSRRFLNFEWLELISQDESMSQQLNVEILKVLRGHSGSFFGVIQALCADYDMHYVPNLGDTPGFLMPRGARVSGPGVLKALPAQAVMAQTGQGGSLMPVQQVLIVGSPENFVWSGAEQQFAENSVVGYLAYPETAPSVTGNIRSVPLPFYLQQALLVTEPSPGKDAVPTISKTIRAYNNFRSKTDAFLSDQAKRFVRSYAKSVYADLALRDSRTTIVLPLDLSWTLGQRYDVTVAGSPVMSGMVSSVQHNLSLSSAETVLGFDYVEYAGFRLPNA